jgi:hypothetical protein
MVDPFSTREIYPTNTHPNRAKPWYMGKGDWLERRYNGIGDWNDAPINPGNGYVVINFHGGDKGRFPVLALRYDQYPTVGPGPVHIIVSQTNQSKLRKRGFMGTIQDWKNVEMTLYFRVVADTTDSWKAMQFGVRGGPHHSDSLFGVSPCWGTALYVALTFQTDSYAYLKKELGHPHYTDELKNKVTNANRHNRWIGMKGIFYTKANGNPYIELWLDLDNNNNWGEKPFLEIEDSGGFYLAEDPDHDGYRMEYDPVRDTYVQVYGNTCGGKTNEQITWGGPGVIFKLDNLGKVDMKWGSVREIIPKDGFSLKLFLNSKDFAPPVSLRSVAEHYGITAPISVNDLIQTVLW